LVDPQIQSKNVFSQCGCAKQSDDQGKEASDACPRGMRRLRKLQLQRHGGKHQTERRIDLHGDQPGENRFQWLDAECPALQNQTSHSTTQMAVTWQYWHRRLKRRALGSGIEVQSFGPIKLKS
jgi:hypothetical protein